MNKIFKVKKNLQLTNYTAKYRFFKIAFIINIIALICLSFFMIKPKSNYRPIIKWNVANLQQQTEHSVLIVSPVNESLPIISIPRNKNVPTFCNNPGALRPSKIQEINDLAIGKIKTKSGYFLYFPNEENGYKALEILIKQIYWEKTISQFIHRYAPTFENNTNKYIDIICKELNCNQETLVKDLDINKLMTTISKIEGYKQ